MRTAFRVCLLLCFAGLQANTQAPPPTLRITVTLVQVDAVVTDSAGRHVPGLRPEDFEILQDGEVQKITYFSYIPDAPNAKRTDDLPRIGPPPSITAGDVKRTVALVVDDLALSFENLVTVREALRKYVEQQMQPGDLVALVRTGGGVAILEQFTTDKRILLEGIDLLKWRFSGRAGLIPIEPLPGASRPAGGPQATPQLLDYSYSLSALGAIGTIEQVVEGMRKQPGRKSVVFLSDSLRMDPTINSAIDHLTDRANRSAVSLYTIDPGGLRTRARNAEQIPGVFTRDPGSAMGFPPIFGGSSDEYRQQEGLSYLASRTGGLFFSNRNDIPDCIRQATEDQLGYYLLGYSPKEGTFEQNAGKAKFHRVQVRVLPRGYQVRWKSGFNGVPDEAPATELATEKTREQQLMDALASPFNATALKVRLTSMFAQTKETGPLVYSLLQFDAKELALSRNDAGVWHASVDIVTSAYRGYKQPMQQRHRLQEISLPDDLYRKAEREGFLYVLTDRMKEPGTFLMRAVVRDTASGRIGSASQFVQVPDTRKGQLAVSGIHLQLATPEILKESGVHPPVSGDQDGKAEAWSEGGPAVRRYRPGHSILFGYQVINPKLKGTAKEFSLVSQVRVFRNGMLFYTGKPAHAVARSPKDPANFVGGGILRLGAALTTGEYLMQLVVTDEFAKKKNSQVAQWVDFEVTPGPAGPG